MFGKLTVFVAAAFAASAPAHSQAYSLGALGSGAPVTTVGVLTGGNPSDVVTFSLASSGGVSASLQNFLVAIGGVSYNLSNATATFYKASDAGAVNIGTLTTAATQNFANLTSGSYFAVVTGVQTGNSGGIYGLSLLGASNAAPAPGPAGFLVFGAGLAGLAMRRRRAARSIANVAA
ncbi:hypothetical protein Q4F19_16890 [Sphingomonas sp. BIUV-7]|uniref:PEP-CTERM protein-sorting domain-containing protein n=1 Tax=Sphingomonas natans TaxID=3063330 RepID=A0ABT8YDP9_9SPHN|nr:hypothetical protein [Sphingomonas sp. BIUV-7]MDO6416067.1 hypothetical protein [Sphingomonas sp. BIUV-7]